VLNGFSPQEYKKLELRSTSKTGYNHPPPMTGPIAKGTETKTPQDTPRPILIPRWIQSYKP
jgi:hypothetical protein